jgi:hypothetical protein
VGQRLVRHLLLLKQLLSTKTGGGKSGLLDGGSKTFINQKAGGGKSAGVAGSVPGVAFDTLATFGTAGTGQNTWTWAHTVNVGTNRLLVVRVMIDNLSPSSVTYGANSLVKLTGLVDSSANRVEYWYLLNPPVGTANIVVNFANPARGVAVSDSFDSVNQITPFGTVVSSTTTLSLSPTSSPGDIVIDAAATFGKSASTVATPDGSQILELSNFLDIDEEGFGSRIAASNGASTPVSWTVSPSLTTRMYVAVAVKHN